MNIDPDAAMTYLAFVKERHRIWERRQAGEPGPWTTDPILAGKKFTNVFRVLDPGSQYVFKLDSEDVTSPVEMLLRLFLYRHTGRPEAWDWLLADLGEYPTEHNLDDVLESWKSYRGDFHVITSGTTTVGGGSRKGRISARPIFTGAYLVFPQSAVPGTDKLESIVALTQRLLGAGVFVDFVRAETQAERFNVLRSQKGVADFMSFQILTDWGYATWGEPIDRENEFVVAGPGTRKGAALVAPGEKPEDVVRWARDVLANMDVTLYGRHPTLVDCANTFCEYFKYDRYQSKPSPQHAYKPAHPGVQLPPTLPRHWAQLEEEPDRG